MRGEWRESGESGENTGDFSPWHTNLCRGKIPDGINIWNGLPKKINLLGKVPMTQDLSTKPELH